MSMTGKLNQPIYLSEMGFKHPEDFDHSFLFDQRYADSASHLVLMFEGDFIVRVDAEALRLRRSPRLVV
jgi:hypothetical protein